MDTTAVSAIGDAFSNVTTRLRYLESHDLPAVLQNLAPNGGFDSWPLGAGPFTANGSRLTPAWTLVLVDSSVSVAPDSASKDFGSVYDAAVAYTHVGGGYARLQQTLAQSSLYIGRSLALSVRVRAPASMTVRAYISTDGGTTLTYSDEAQVGSGSYQTLTIVVVVPATAGTIVFGVEVTGASGTAYVDNLFLTNSDGAFEYRPALEKVDAVAEGYAHLIEMPTPTVPLANEGFLYAKDVSGVSTPFWMGDNGTEFNLLIPTSFGPGAGVALTKTDDTNVTLTLTGDPTHALVHAANVAVGWTGQLSVPRGGTGLASVAQGDLLYGSGVNAYSTLAKNTSTSRYLSNSGSSNNPAWAQVDLTTGVTGVLPVANGGSGAGTYTTDGVLYGAGTSAILATAQGPANSVLTANAGPPSFSATPTLTSLTLTATAALTFTNATAQIIPGATTLSIRDTANARDNILIGNAGTAAFYSRINVNTSGADNESIIRRDNATTAIGTAVGTLELTNQNNTDNNWILVRFVSVDTGGPTIRNTAFLGVQVVTHGVSFATSNMQFYTANASQTPGLRMTLGLAGAGADIIGDSTITTTTGAILALARNDTSVTAADVLGRLDFRSNDTSTTTNFIAANIEVQAVNTITTDINPGRMIFRTTPITVAATPLERFRLDEQGSAIFSYRVQHIQGADVASANNLVLGGDGNVFSITGTTQVNLIANTNWQNGSIITLLFAGIVTVKHNQATSGANTTIQLNAAADFVSAAGYTLTLVLAQIGGTQAWREIGRKV